MQDDASTRRRKKNRKRALVLVAFLCGMAVQYVGARMIPYFVEKIQGASSAELTNASIGIVHSYMHSFFRQHQRYPENWQELYTFDPALGGLPPLYRNPEYVLIGGSSATVPLVYQSHPYVVREPLYAASLPTGESVFLLPEELQEIIEMQKDNTKQ